MHEIKTAVGKHDPAMGPALLGECCQQFIEFN